MCIMATNDSRIGSSTTPPSNGGGGEAQILVRISPVIEREFKRRNVFPELRSDRAVRIINGATGEYRVAKTGRLVDGCSGSLTWNRGSEQTGSAGFLVVGDVLRIACAINGQPVDLRIPIDRTPCTYGGSRPWFECPGCGKRKAVLYLRQSAFKCRNCARVAYRSQSEDAIGRTWLKQQKAEAKLGKNWSRPKGMHEATAERLRAIIWDCEEVRENSLAMFIGQHEKWL
jgi:hypothetical protein